LPEKKEWIESIERETDYLVKKGYGWSDVRGMPAYKRKNYVNMNLEYEKKSHEAPLR
jgi:hypothetical protein